MSAPGIAFGLPGAVVSFDTAGGFLGVRADAEVGTGGDGWLAPGMAPERLIVDGHENGWVSTGCVADVDEIEVAYAAIDHPQLTAVLRHTVSVVWGTRLALSNTGPEPITIDRVTLGLRSGAGYRGWALAAGATSAYTLLPENGVGPLLGWSLQHGEISHIDDDGLHCAQVRIAGGGRYVVQFLWSFHDLPAQLHRSRSFLVPEQLCLTVGNPIEVVDEDTALVAPEAVEITTSDGIRELISDRPGHFPIELRSGRGTTRFEMQWTPPESQVLAATADRLLDGPRTPAGVTKLEAGHQAILVQHALTEMVIMDPELGSDALELYSSLLMEHPPGDPLDLAFLCGEWIRTGDPDLLEKALGGLLQTRVAEPGLGMAATRLCVCLMMDGRPVDEVMATLAGLRPPSSSAVADMIAELELILMLSNVEDPGSDLLDRVQRLGAHLGYGLPGGAVEPIDPDLRGYLIAVFGLLPDRAGDVFRETWGMTPQALAERWRPSVLSHQNPAGDRGLAWLVLGRPPN